MTVLMVWIPEWLAEEPLARCNSFLFIPLLFVTFATPSIACGCNEIVRQTFPVGRVGVATNWAESLKGVTYHSPHPCWS